MFQHLFPVLFDQDERPGGGDAPWAADLTGLGLDEQHAAAVDGYLRDTWQPRMTQFEQQLREAEPARALYNDFMESPQETLLAVSEQLLSEEQSQALARILNGEESTEDTPPATETAMDPRLEELLAEREAQQAAAAYEAELAKVREADPDVDTDLIHPFVIAADGDFDKAVANYKTYVAAFTAKFGQVPDAADIPDAPASLGTGETGQQPPAPPVQARYGSLDAAMDDAMSDIRSARQAPPSVGTV